MVPCIGVDSEIGIGTFEVPYAYMKFKNPSFRLVTSM